MHGLLHRRLPDRAARRESARQAPARDLAGERVAPAARRPVTQRQTPSTEPADRAPGSRGRLRRRRSVDRGRRPGRRADEGLGRQGPAPRDDRRHRRLRRPLRRLRAAQGYERPLLATSTDGVGTKVAIAQALDVHDTIGFDLVGMVVDDLVVCGAEPLFMTDYIACGQVVPERIAAIVKGIAEACVEAGCALVGGETAEHPGLLRARRVRRGRRDHRRGRGRPAARPGPGAAR